MDIDVNALECWSDMAAQAIQGVIDDSVEASPDTPPEDLCQDLRKLLSELERIKAGGSSLMTELMAMPEDESCGALNFL
jgi:hypothetical protein